MRACGVMTLLALGGLRFAGAAQSAGCEDPGATREIERCAAVEQKAVEAMLNATYQRVLQSFGDKDEAEIKRKLVEAQRAWVRYREADCNAVYEKWSGGTIRGAMYVGCMRARAEQRIKELEDFGQRY